MIKKGKQTICFNNPPTILETASKELARGKEHFSVSVVDVPQDEWKEKVYDKVKKDDNTIIQPGYEM